MFLDFLKTLVYQKLQVFGCLKAAFGPVEVSLFIFFSQPETLVQRVFQHLFSLELHCSTDRKGVCPGCSLETSCLG